LYLGRSGVDRQDSSNVLVTAKENSASCHWIRLNQALSGKSLGLRKPRKFGAKRGRCPYPDCKYASISACSGYCFYHASVGLFPRGARQRKIGVLLTDEQIFWYQHQDCLYCGISSGSQPDETRRSGRNGIDRIDPAVREYQHGANCATCCWACNMGKHDKSPQQWVDFLLQSPIHSGRLLLIKQEYDRRGISVTWPKWFIDADVKREEFMEMMGMSSLYAANVAVIQPVAAAN